MASEKQDDNISRDASNYSGDNGMAGEANPGANNASNQDADLSRADSGNITSQDNQPTSDSKPDAESSQNPDNSEAAESGPTEEESEKKSGEDETEDGVKKTGQPLPPNFFADQAQSGKNNSEDDEQRDESEKNEEGSMGLLDHLNELRGRLVKACIAVAVCFGICWAFVDPLFEILLNPLLAILPEGTHAQYTTLPEAFFTRMYIAFMAAIFMASPVIFYQIWAFVAPGLYDEEKRYIIPIAFLSAVFFIGGALFCYYIVFPFAFNFFISYSTPEIVITPKVSDYLSFVIKLLIAFGLIFEMPIFTLFLARLGILTAAMMRRARRYAIVIIFILAAILTPPDVVSQLLMACPMLLLYELSIGVAVVFGRKKKKDKTAGNEAEKSDTPESVSGENER